MKVIKKFPVVLSLILCLSMLFNNNVFAMENSINGGSVGVSHFKGYSVGSWEHEHGNIEYVNSEYGKNLEVSATGLLTFAVPIKIKEVVIPGNLTTEQTFLYFHAV